MSEEANLSDLRAAPVLRRYRDLPGPRGIPLIGNGHQVRATRFHQQLEAWAQQYGKVFRLRIGPRRLMVASDAASMSAILRDRPDGFRRPTRHGNLIREMGFDQGLFFANDEVWKRQRRMVMSAFNPTHVKAYFPSLLKVTGRLEKRWQAARSAGDTIDLQADLMRFTVDAISGLAFGVEVNTLESDDDIIQRHLNRIFPALGRRALGAVPYWRYVRLPSDRALDRSVAEVKAAIEGFIAAARRRLDDDPERREQPRNLLEAMIVAADVEGGGLDDRDIAGNVLVMLVAGEDTTANTIAWLIHFLHRHPDARQRARDEVLRVAPTVEGFTMEQLGALDYVEACVHEAMRLKPVAPVLPLELVRDATVAGVDVPAGTIVVALLRAAAVDAAHFPEPSQFRPERWLRSEASSSSRLSMPFGAGPRLCPGRYLALLEIKMAMAMLLGHFEIESLRTLEGDTPHEVFAFAMGPSPMQMRLAPGRP
ncbi:MAG: cytochrome P450 [Pseudomonadota bacterium]|nr:cytochrome P450 [Pseudomonadota bacterium]